MDGFGRHHNIPEFLRTRKILPKAGISKVKESRGKLSQHVITENETQQNRILEVDTARMFEPKIATAHQSEEVQPQSTELGFSDRNLVADSEVIKLQRELLVSRERLQTRETGKDSYTPSRGLLSRESKASGIYRTQGPIKLNFNALKPDTQSPYLNEELELKHSVEEISFSEMSKFNAVQWPVSEAKSPILAEGKPIKKVKLETVNENTNDHYPSSSLLDIQNEHIHSFFETKPKSFQSNNLKKHLVNDDFNQRLPSGSERQQENRFREKRTLTAGLNSSPTRKLESSQIVDRFSKPIVHQVKIRQKSKLMSRLPSMKNLHTPSKLDQQDSPRIENEFRPFRVQRKYGLHPSASEPALKLRLPNSTSEAAVIAAPFKQIKFRTVNSDAQMFFGAEHANNLSKGGGLETSAHVPQLGRQAPRVVDRWTSDPSLPALSRQTYSDYIRHNLGELPRLVDRRIAEKIMQENKQLRSTVVRDNMIINMLSENLFV
jgi:hypothetical protein